MADRDWTDQLPKALKLRFDGLGTYVSAVLEEQPKRRPLSKDTVRQIQTIVFIKTLDEFLREGSNAAIRAVDLFRDLGVDGFRLGTQDFVGRNEAVMRGSVLADRLRLAVADEPLRRFIASERPLRTVIIDAARYLSERRVD